VSRVFFEPSGGFFSTPSHAQATSSPYAVSPACQSRLLLLLRVRRTFTPLPPSCQRFFHPFFSLSAFPFPSRGIHHIHSPGPPPPGHKRPLFWRAMAAIWRLQADRLCPISTRGMAYVTGLIWIIAGRGASINCPDLGGPNDHFGPTLRGCCSHAGVYLGSTRAECSSRQ